LKPSATINPPEVTVSVWGADLSNIEFGNPGMHEMIVRVFVEKDLPPPTIGLILENSVMGSIIGKPPEIATDDSAWAFPANILSAIATHGRSANVRLVALEPHGLKDPLTGLYLPEPFGGQEVPSLEQLSDGAFRIVLPAGAYQLGVLVPFSKTPFSVDSMTSGSIDLLSRPLEIPNNDSKEIHIRLRHD